MKKENNQNQRVEEKQGAHQVPETSILVHELSNPLSTLSYKMEALLKTHLDPKQKELAQAVCRSSKRVLDLVQDTKNKIQSRRQQQKQPRSIVEICQDSIFFTQKKCDDAKVNLSLKYKNDFFALVCPMQISQVLINLINNSTNAYQKNNYDIDKIKINLSIEQDSSYITILCEDFAGGIENLGQDQSQEGMGIGLSICKDLVHQNNGRLDYAPTKKGSLFSIKLPKA